MAHGARPSQSLRTEPKSGISEPKPEPYIRSTDIFGAPRSPIEHWAANLATRVRSPVGEEPSDLICAFLHVQMESNWLGCQCVTVGTLASDVAL